MIGAKRPTDDSALKKDKIWFGCHSPIARKYSFLRASLIFLALSLPGLGILILAYQDKDLFKAHNVMLYTGFGIVGFSVVSCLVTLALAFTIAPGCEALHRQSRVEHRDDDGTKQKRKKARKMPHVELTPVGYGEETY